MLQARFISIFTTKMGFASSLLQAIKKGCHVCPPSKLMHLSQGSILERLVKKDLQLIKRLRLGNTTGWQHRFSDLTILSPIWLGTYEYMKSTLEKFFFRFETGLSEWIFQIWSKMFKSDPDFVYMKKSLF